MKSIIKEVISMILIAIAMVIILVLVFYDYLNINTEDTEVVEYSRDAEVTNALADNTVQSNQIIASLSRSMYSLNSDDVSDYVSEGIIDRGKEHPFSDIESNTYDIDAADLAENETSTSTSTTTTSTNGNNNDREYNSSNSGSSNNNSNSSSNNNSSSTSQNNGSSSSTKEDDNDENEEDDKPFFDNGTSK